MKKLIVLISFLCFALFVSAQDKVITNYGTAGANFFPLGTLYNGFATHKLLHNAAKTAAYNYTFQINIPKAYVYTASVHLRDHEAGTANTATIIVKGSVDGFIYQAIDTITYSTSADSLSIFGSRDLIDFTHSASNKVPNLYPLSFKFLRLMITPTDSIWVRSLWLNVLPIN